MKVSIKGFISMKPSESCNGEMSFNFWPVDMSAYGHATIQPHTIEIDLPEDFDPRAKQIELLQKQKQKAMADFQALVTQIDRQISELTAIEYSV